MKYDFVWSQEDARGHGRGYFIRVYNDDGTTELLYPEEVVGLLNKLDRLMEYGRELVDAQTPVFGTFIDVRTKIKGELK